MSEVETKAFVDEDYFKSVLGELKKRIFTWGNDIYNWISKYKANYSSSESPYNV